MRTRDYACADKTLPLDGGLESTAYKTDLGNKYRKGLLMDNSRSRKQRRRPKGVTAMVQAHAQLPSPVSVPASYEELVAAAQERIAYAK